MVKENKQFLVDYSALTESHFETVTSLKKNLC